MAMTPKETILAALTHQSHDRIPNYLTDVVNGGFGFGNGPDFEKGPLGGGIDGFGVSWVCPSSGGGAPIPEPGKFILDSETIVDWKKIVKFPNILEDDWEARAKWELGRGDRSVQAVDYGSGNGPFERLAALMGFEEALIAMACEPEAVSELLNAIADYKISVIEMAHKYYHPDIYTNYDDIATQNDLFMSMDMYRDIIKPVHKRLYDAARAYDMIPVQHTCGKAESVVDDMIEIGVSAWTSVQPTNDISSILEKHTDDFCLIGGYDTTGEPSRSGASQETVEAEVDRCFQTYGTHSNYVFFGFLLEDSLDAEQRQRRLAPLVKAALKYQ